MKKFNELIKEINITVEKEVSKANKVFGGSNVLTKDREFETGFAAKHEFSGRLFFLDKRDLENENVGVDFDKKFSNKMIISRKNCFYIDDHYNIQCLSKLIIKEVYKNLGFFKQFNIKEVMIRKFVNEDLNLFISKFYKAPMTNFDLTTYIIGLIIVNLGFTEHGNIMSDNVSQELYELFKINMKIMESDEDIMLKRDLAVSNKKEAVNCFIGNCISYAEEFGLSREDILKKESELNLQFQKNIHNNSFCDNFISLLKICK